MTRNRNTTSSVFFVASFLCCCVQFLSSPVRAQQTLGGITGTVTDASGGILPNTTVNLVNDQTKLSRTQTTNGSCIYDFPTLPIGTCPLTFTHGGANTHKSPS